MPAGLQRWLLAQWFRPDPSLAARLAQPLAALYGWLQARHRQARQRESASRLQPALPIVVVGNLVVGGAGKTPTTIAIVRALQSAGRRPGVVSRGHGRRASDVLPVTPDSDAAQVGDEPLVIARRTGAPVVVGRDRVAAAQRLCLDHPEVDVLVADDGLQHRRLRRELEVIVFDERGVGNGLLLPSGPLREPWSPSPPAGALVLYTAGRRSTGWPGHVAQRHIVGVRALHDWWRGSTAAAPLSTLQGRPLLAMAGIAVPQRFFAMLAAAGLSPTPLPLPDHHDYASPPWPADCADIVTTEKDAAKLRPAQGGLPRIWVAELDLQLPGAFVDELLARVRAHP